MFAFITTIPISSSSSLPQITCGRSHLCSTSFFTPLRATRSIARSVFPVVVMQETDFSNDEFNAREPEEQDKPVHELSKLFVGNLSWDTTDSSLGAAFEEYGTVIDAKVIMDRFTGKSRGFGFIEFEDPSSARKALEEMNGRLVDGRPVRVDRANQRPLRRRY